MHEITNSNKEKEDLIGVSLPSETVRTLRATAATQAAIAIPPSAAIHYGSDDAWLPQPAAQGVAP